MTLKPKNSLSNSVAILIFARNATEEAFKKTLSSKNRESNFQLINHLNHHTNQTALSTSLPTFVSSHLHLPKKSTFGENFVLAIEDILKKGYEKIICIGNDCPALSSKELLRAAQALENSEVVLGPDYRGGAYLIGLTKESLDKEKILSLPWQTSDLFNKFLKQFSKNSITILDPHHDINTKKDLIEYPENKSFISQLIHLFKSTYRTIYFYYDKKLIQNPIQVRKLRGPPKF